VCGWDVLGGLDAAKPPEKQRTNVTLSSSNLAAARELGLNVSAISDAALAEAVRAAKADAWARENAEAIAERRALDRGQRDPARGSAGPEHRLMAHFQVCRIAGNRLVLDLQTDLIETGTRVVTPLFPAKTGPKPIGRLEPVFEIEGAAHVLHTVEMAAIPSALLKAPPVADLSRFDDENRGARDMVFSGF
jgi:toxin CcdB